MFGEAFGEWVDHALMSDASTTFFGFFAFPAAHLMAVVAALKFGRPNAIFAVNVSLSFLVLFYLLSQPEYFRDIFEGGKDPFWLPAAAEALVLVCGAAALLRAGWAKAPSYVFFALHAIGFGVLVLVGIAFGIGEHR